jgi:cytochrome b561
MFRSKLSEFIKSGTNRLQKFSTDAIAIHQSYSLPTQFFHWSTATCFVGCIVTVQMAQSAKGKRKGDLMFIHKSFGTAALGLVGPRIITRLLSKAPQHIPGPTWEKYAASASHTLLYAFAFFMPMSGFVMSYYSGKGLPFFFTTIDVKPEKPNGEIAKKAYGNHKLGGQFLEYVLLPLHLGGTAVHVLKGYPIFARILPIAPK